MKGLLEKVIAGDVDGIIITQPLFNHFKTELGKTNYLPKELPRDIIIDKKGFLKDKMVTGIVVKAETDYRFFKAYLETNWAKIQGCYEYEFHSKYIIDASNENNPMEGTFLYWPSLAAVGFIICFGVLYEIRRKRQTNGERVMHEIHASDINNGRIVEGQI